MIFLCTYSLCPTKAYTCAQIHNCNKTNRQLANGGLQKCRHMLQSSDDTFRLSLLVHTYEHVCKVYCRHMYILSFKQKNLSILKPVSHNRKHCTFLVILKKSLQENCKSAHSEFYRSDSL